MSIKHGTSSGFKKCVPKCKLCSEYSTKIRSIREKLLKENPELFKDRHGDYLYVNYNCRCPICIESARLKSAKRRNYKKEKAIID